MVIFDFPSALFIDSLLVFFGSKKTHRSAISFIAELSGRVLG